MKKIIKKICKFIGKIILFIDKWIITPIMKLVLKLNTLFKSSGKVFEKVITTKRSLLIISLLLAFLLFYIVDNNSNSIITNKAEILYNQPVEAIYNEEAYVVEGLPSSVDVILIGRSSDIYLAKQYPNQKISLDLREYGIGTHRVSLKYRESISAVEYKIDPSNVTIVIHDKVSAMREVTYEILHRELLDSKLDISKVVLSQSEVTIKGSEKQINSVAYVKALIDIDNMASSEIGTTNVKGVKLVAYDTDGKIVDVEILPETLNADLTLVSSSKTVPIKIVPVGDLAIGYSIGSLSANATNIVIYGDKESLNNIEFVEVKVDINGLSNNKDFTLNIAKPNGVREMSLKTINVKLTVDGESQLEISDVEIVKKNLLPTLTANLASSEYSKVTVIVKGSLKLLNGIDKNSINASVNLEKITAPGEYELPIEVTGSDLKLTYSSKTTKVKIIVYKAS